MSLKKFRSISFIIPVFNEEKSLTILFKEIMKFRKKYKTVNSEFILVNDGSTDSSLRNLKALSLNKNFIKIIDLKKNYGKGYALKKGVYAAKNNFILTLDADLSVKFEQIIPWIKYINFLKNDEVYFASRNHQLSKIKFKFHRKFIGLILSVFIYFLVDSKLKDTQCGFKLYRKKQAKKIFKNLKINGFSHDIEIIFLLKKYSNKIVELPVKWIHKPDSKVNLLTEPISFILIIIFLKFKYYI
tara:strand:+ start:72 stop:800 length:729 start_codon:yes stop_codon:yes gene_type:complete